MNIPPKPDNLKMSSRSLHKETLVVASRPKALQNPSKQPDNQESKVVPLFAPTGRVPKTSICMPSFGFEPRKTVKLIDNGICVANNDQIKKAVGKLIKTAKGN